MTDNEYKACPQCHTPNSLQARFCEQCGFAFGTLPSEKTVANKATISVPKSELRPGDQTIHPPKAPPNLPPRVISFQIHGGGQPIFSSIADKLYLGRENSIGTDPCLDLTPYNASSFGVSRQHALIELDSGEYLFQDVGSTNGSMLNNQAVSPFEKFVLKSGDELRLGRMVIWIHLGAAATGRIDHILCLHGFKQPMSLTRLSEELLVYLQTVDSLHNITNELLVDKKADLSLSLIDMQHDRAYVTIAGTSPALDFIKARLLTSKPNAAYSANKLTRNIEGMKTGDFQFTSDGAVTRYVVSDEELMSITSDYIRSLPARESTSNVEAVKKLSPYFRVLLQSRLQLVPTER